MELYDILFCSCAALVEFHPSTNALLHLLYSAVYCWHYYMIMSKSQSYVTIIVLRY